MMPTPKTDTQTIIVINHQLSKGAGGLTAGFAGGFATILVHSGVFIARFSIWI